MKEFSLLSAVFASFYSADLYRDIRTRWGGIGFLYLLFLVALVVTPAIIAACYQIYQFASHENELKHEGLKYIHEVLEQIPPITVKNGEMSADIEQPYYIKHTFSVDIEGGDIQQESVVAIIDENGSIEDLRKSDAFILFTRDSIHAKTDGGNIETHQWSEAEEDLYFDKDMAFEGLETALGWIERNLVLLLVSMGTFTWLSCLVILFMYRVIQSLIYGAIGMAVCAMLNVQMMYQTAVRIACVAMTPAIFIDLGFRLAIGEGISVLMAIVITVGFIVFAIRSNRNITPSSAG